MGKKCILTGGAGFLGLNTAKALLKAGYKVVVVDTNLTALSFFPEIVENIEVHAFDYRDSEKIRMLLKGQGTLFHFAYASVPSTSMIKMNEDVVGNVVESVKLFDLAVQNGIKKIIFPSSGGTVYGNVEVSPIKEDSPANPICSYGITKLMIEKYLFLFHEIFNLDFLIFRIANPYGPGQNPKGQQGLVAKVIDKIINSEPIIVFGNGENKRDYIYIEDVTAAFVSGVRREFKNDIFNIGTSQGKSIMEIIDLVSTVIGTKAKISFFPKRLIDVKSNILDNSKAENLLHWKPKITLEEGVQKTYDWIKKRVNHAKD